MNYVILNGVKSNTINGLMIQSLPPISKPLMRTEVEEIDGKDGDIVTNLGYSAYDKEMLIGLYGDYNIDDVIGYFNSSGIVTFSNEPDKYYNYQIIQQIDFERLIRYKTATVVFHVQPFKYSAVENQLIYKNDFVDVPNFTTQKNGVTLTAQNNIISVSGTALTATEIYVPIENQKIEGGNYTLNASVNGDTANVCSIRLIGSAPSNSDSFGSNYLPLQSNGVSSLGGYISSSGKTYGYLWFYFNPKGAMSFSVDVSLVKSSFNSVTVRNEGNTISRPIITLSGSGKVKLSINSTQVFSVDFGTGDTITLDGIEMNAYDAENVLMNRFVSGNYDNLVFNVGSNVVSWSGGTLTAIELDNYSRWL